MAAGADSRGSGSVHARVKPDRFFLLARYEGHEVRLESGRDGEPLDISPSFSVSPLVIHFGPSVVRLFATGTGKLG